MYTIPLLLLLIGAVDRIVSDPVGVAQETTAACSVRLGVLASGLGVYNRTFNDVPYCAFLGIPYVKPPVGELRFADPVHHDPEGHRNYTAYGSMCPQFENINKQEIVLGQEDCLFLNVFTPKVRYETDEHPVRYPVLMFIHGGSFIAGSGEVHGADLLVESELIVITVNYRLGVLGFMKNERENITGNYGLKDQVAALHWIRRNIHFFGGDPDRVTLMGHSAGSGSVSHHVYYAPARGLFHGAIMLGGSMLAPWAMLYDQQRCMENYLHDIHASNLSQIRGMDVKGFFIRDSLYRHTYAFCSMFYLCFVPTLEDHPEDPGVYFRKSPHRAVIDDPPPQIPILISETSTEFRFLLPHVAGYWMSENFVNNANPQIKRQTWSIMHNICRWAVAQGLVETKNAFFRNMANMANLHYPIRRLRDDMDHRLDPDLLYYMQFEFDGKFGEYKKKTYAEYMKTASYGAVHGDELGYIFNPYNLREALANRTEFKKEFSVHIKTVEVIANFVKYGNPTPKRSKLSGVVWPSYREASNQTQYLNVDEEFTLRQVDERRNLYFLTWQIIYECLYYSQCKFMKKLEHLSDLYGYTVESDDEYEQYDEE